MVRGRGGYPRGTYRGNSWKGAGGYGRSSPDRYSFGGKYGSDMYRMDDYSKSYRMDDFSNDWQSPERKRVSLGSRHDSYGGGYNSGRYEPYPPERRGFSAERERHMATSSPYSPRREDFRRLGNRVSRSGRRDRGAPSRRRLPAESYGIRKKGMRPADRRAKIIKLRSYSGSRHKQTAEGGDQVESDASDSAPEKKEDDEGEEEKEIIPKAEKPEGEEVVPMKEIEETTEAEKPKEGVEKAEEEKPKEKDDAESKTTNKKKFFKLDCPRCHVTHSTFRNYELHLHGRTHKLAMSKVALKRRLILSQIRLAQRNAQNDLEKNTSKDELTTRTHLCRLCKLNYRQPKAVHQSSQAHKNMKKYLMPFCKVCKLSCRSPMFYENHICSIDHLKCKQRAAANGEESTEEDNLEEFTTIDSVGDVEENVPSGDEDKAEINVGVERIKKVEVYYCELCRMYLRRGGSDEDEIILSAHCKKRSHMQRYINHKENEALRQRAEKLQRMETAEKGKKKEDTKKEGDENMDTSDAKQTNKTEEDKLWDSVDKDLGELLEEGDGNKSDYDDDDSRVNGERYDRFRSDEGKSGEEDKTETPDIDKGAVQAEKKAEPAE
ncbi:uncharacterized protein LOC143203446 isoform X1 [Rhynchophorus ferrugineus]|uniref:uncharacterized protein LOC143203446 isoform X1 n=1 Tax=Rhynchophorus ferrugineus TaxID=354439 RepID=UPI003FCD423B